LSTSGGRRSGRTGERAGRPRGSDVPVAGRTRRAPGKPPRARRRRRPVLLLVASLALLVPIGLQIHLTMADRAVAAQAITDKATADRAAADQAAADQARADKAAADQARADEAAADQARADKAAADQTAADQAAADKAAADVRKAEAAQPKPGTVGLEPALAQAFNRARTAALAAGLDLRVNSGFRTVAAQQRLFDDAIATYGSPEKARRWVLPPAESNHVKGLAVDVAPAAGAAWLEKHGVSYGLCRRYVNEWWHFELLAPAAGQRCPAMEPFAGG
jgi:D-alanyl-D-alanine carboxypeptidase